MKLKKLIYSIAAVSIIAPVAIGSFNSSTAQASTKSHAVSNKIAYKYSYKAAKTFKYNSGTTFKDFKGVSGVEKKIIIHWLVTDLVEIQAFHSR